jgi:hypothetical protein
MPFWVYWVIPVTVFGLGFSLGCSFGKRTMLNLIEKHVIQGESGRDAVAYERAILEGRRLW